VGKAPVDRNLRGGEEVEKKAMPELMGMEGKKGKRRRRRKGGRKGGRRRRRRRRKKASSASPETSTHRRPTEPFPSYI
jgi:hypothetical protein